MTWFLAPSLAAMRSEANTIAPRRSKSSDGSIGDADHSARTSDHNPADNGAVCAIDLTHDPAGGWDCNARVAQLVGDPRVKYLIWNRRIWTPARGWHPYVGKNPHDHHMHVSVFNTDAARNNLAAWWTAATTTPTTSKEDTMTPEQRNEVVGRLDTAIGLLQAIHPAVAQIQTGVMDPVAGVRTMVVQLLGQAQTAADPTQVAQAIAAALPDDLARQVSDELARRLAA